MITRTMVQRGLAALAVLWMVPAGAQQVVTHDPWLNWDFRNLNLLPAYDFDIIVDANNFALPTPGNMVSPPGWSLTVQHTTLGGGDSDNTLLHWSGLTPINAGDWAHFGAYMGGSGPILDAYWTDAEGDKLGLSLPITYEQTWVYYPADEGPAWLGMELSWPDSFFDVVTDWEGVLEDWYPGGPWTNAQFGLTGIRTFAQIPAETLDLSQLNETFLGTAGLDALEAQGYERTPREDGPLGLEIDPTKIYQVESFFDVFIDLEPGFTPSPEFESLLYAQVVVDLDGDGLLLPVPIGAFWNLNSQSPEPSTGLLLAAVGMALALRRTKRPCAG